MNTSRSCISCATISGILQPPGGVVFENQYWIVVLRSNPVRFPCLPLLIFKRHEEDIANLDPEESSSLGAVMQQTAFALSSVLKPARVHFGIYAEEVRHLHVHVFPRMPQMPAGNIPNLWIGRWTDILHTLKLKKAFTDEIVAVYANKLRLAFLENEKHNQ